MFDYEHFYSLTRAKKSPAWDLTVFATPLIAAIEDFSRRWFLAEKEGGQELLKVSTKGEILARSALDISLDEHSSFDFDKAKFKIIKKYK